ncbi:MAG: 4a-hydroxytetrahydrobiopterin dehydratase [Betaproteobacteria bacterium]|nr:4a-hydroxytetrahydrobiopterin dehydratase [Betaproteobacteria bacterium]
MDRVYTEQEARLRLSVELPHWQMAGGMLHRVYRTNGWKAALMVVNTVGHLAEAAWHHPDLDLRYGQVAVKLFTHKAGGITDKDFALARKIEEVVQWQPALEQSPLKGTPNHEPRFKYLEYDRERSAA